MEDGVSTVCAEYTILEKEHHQRVVASSAVALIGASEVPRAQSESVRGGGKYGDFPSFWGDITHVESVSTRGSPLQYRIQKLFMPRSCFS